MVQYAGRGKSLKQLNLTLWRPRTEARITLTFLGDGLRLAPIETGGKGKNSGEGSVTILPRDPRQVGDQR